MMSYVQARYLKDKKIILSFDNDDAGKVGAKKAYQLLKRLNTESMYQAQPPEGFKDWNAFHIKVKDKKIFHAYVKNSIHKMDFGFFVTNGLAND